MNLAESLLRALKARGATEVFGIPGDFALPLFREIEGCAVLPLHTLSHEPAVGFAADAAARARGGLGVAAVTYGAGAINLLNTVAGASLRFSKSWVVPPGTSTNVPTGASHHRSSIKKPMVPSVTRNTSSSGW